jgi:UDP-2,3-diacylglucosamine pyrophosphatase LpxH
MYNTVFISDIHLGTSRCNVDKFLNFLNTLETKKLVIVGDFIDIHCMEKYNSNWTKKHTMAVKKVLDLSLNDIEVVYVIGNHDEVVRNYIKYLPLNVGKISICDQYIFETTGKKYLCDHGDRNSKYSSGSWKQIILNWGYEFITPINTLTKKYFNWSFVNFLKNLNQAKIYIDNYENDEVKYGKSFEGISGIITGHIHHLNVRTIDNFVYINCGDWCDTCSYIAEINGEFLPIKFP